jgi:AcrR family transcriptional regulator
MRPKRANGATTLNRLLDAALTIWSEEGLEGITMDAVAKRAGNTRGTVYHHFADRGELIVATRNWMDDRMAAIFDINKGPHRDENDYLVVAGIMVDSPELLRSYLLRLLGQDPTHNTMISLARKHYRDVDAYHWLRPGIDPDHAAMISISMWMASVLVVDLKKGKTQRRAAANAFARTMQTVMERSIIFPSAERKLPRS